MIKKTLSILVLLGVSSGLYAEEHHDLEISICRALPSGNILLRGVSSTDNQNRDLVFTESSSLKEAVLDRYLSLCMAAFATGKILRADNLICTGTSCNPTGATSLSLKK
ncbi:hypothetical protein [Teredinibacter sp. KSP-S5-2]|uniref:hypothetical protein n=1 Tax=Teredinibacter sp. KSP-S5-2 TaxID=3034506 RepID=UPI00293500E4|nr:hypothetical protein [Teredinibacter sp. KSP-S5-2]WNO11177.1 hypothetical protein P5V12_08325 [Teredinibacter sp. KSP-S5-2]